MAAIGASDVVVTINKNRIIRGSPGMQQRNVVKLVFGDGALTYPALGIPLPTHPSFGMRRELELLLLIDQHNAGGLIHKYDFVNKKIRLYQAKLAAGVVIEEVVTLAANTGTLRMLPAHIFMAFAQAGTNTGEFQVIPVGETPATLQVAVNMATGALTTVVGDAVTRMVVSYIPRAALADESDLVVDEVVTIDGSDEGVLAFNACAVQCVYTSNGATPSRAIREKGLANTAVTAAQVSIDFTPAAGNTELTFDDDIAQVSAKVTYLKAGAFPLIEEEAVTLSSEAGDVALPGVPATGQWINGVGGTAGPALLTRMEKAAASLGGGVAQWHYQQLINAVAVAIQFDESTPVTSDKITYIQTNRAGPLNGKLVLQELNTLATFPQQTAYGEAVGW